MKRETTPVRISDRIMELCGQVVPGVEPVYIPVAVQPWCLPRECFPNVKRMVKVQGGCRVNGWAVWQWANILVETEAHAVWESLEGTLIDVTPHDYGEKSILFLRDSSMVYTDQNIKSVKMALTNSPLIAELIQLSTQTEAVMCDYKPGTEIPIEELQRRLAPMSIRQNEIMSRIYQTVGRNDPCPCQSGLKYKKCCE